MMITDERFNELISRASKYAKDQSGYVMSADLAGVFLGILHLLVENERPAPTGQTYRADAEGEAG